MSRHDGPIIAPSALKHGLTVDEILAHADELAARFEDYEPDPADEVDAEAPTLLRAAVAERSQAERHLLEAVAKARSAGMSWAAIGALVGTSGEAARQRYGSRGTSTDVVVTGQTVTESVAEQRSSCTTRVGRGLPAQTPPETVTTSPRLICPSPRKPLQHGSRADHGQHGNQTPTQQRRSRGTARRPAARD